MVQEQKNTIVISFTIGFNIFGGKSKSEFTGIMANQTPSLLISENTTLAESISQLRQFLRDYIFINAAEKFISIPSIYIFLNIVKIVDTKYSYSRPSRVWALGIREIRDEFIKTHGQKEYDDTVRYHNKIRWS